MKACPKCGQRVEEGMKFCPACGAQVTGEVSNASWISGIQEEIKECRRSETSLGIICGMGIVIAALPFIMSVFLTGSLTGSFFAPGLQEVNVISLVVGIIIAGFGGVMGQHYDNKKKKLIQKLKGRDT